MRTAIQTKTSYTPDESFKLPDRDLYELVDGELVKRFMSAISGIAGLNIGSRLRNFGTQHRLGWTFTSSSGLQCFARSPLTVRWPDAAFILAERLTIDQLWEEGWVKVVPDLAVEVVSPNDLAYEVRRKAQEYLAACVRLVWVIYPPSRDAEVFRSDGTKRLISEVQELDGEAVIPGFRCRVGDLFPPPPPSN
jgi:Uma2 family endonuclease